MVVLISRLLQVTDRQFHGSFNAMSAFAVSV